MVRAIIRPQYTNITITVPTSYIDKDIELIMFPLEKEKPMKTSIKRKSLRGVFNKYANNAKYQEEEGAWQMHVMEEFKKYD
jgi:hypothetical protein